MKIISFSKIKTKNAHSWDKIMNCEKRPCPLEENVKEWAVHFLLFLVPLSTYQVFPFLHQVGQHMQISHLIFVFSILASMPTLAFFLDHDTTLLPVDRLSTGRMMDGHFLKACSAAAWIVPDSEKY